MVVQRLGISGVLNQRDLICSANRGSRMLSSSRTYASRANCDRSALIQPQRFVHDVFASYSADESTTGGSRRGARRPGRVATQV